MAVAAREDGQVMSELNTTPLIDVMLVLLIMFIITIPVQTHSVPIDLPVGETEVVVERERNKLVIDRTGAAYWNGASVSMDQLEGALYRMAAMPQQPELQFEPHAEARYERVGAVLALIKRTNISMMGMVGNERYAVF
jgi:biopolymer transport protein ExbD